MAIPPMAATLSRDPLCTSGRFRGRVPHATKASAHLEPRSQELQRVPSALLSSPVRPPGELLLEWPTDRPCATGRVCASKTVGPRSMAKQKPNLLHDFRPNLAGIWGQNQHVLARPTCVNGVIFSSLLRFEGFERLLINRSLRYLQLTICV